MEVAKHPAKFSDPILAKIETVMWRNVPTLDPFVGVGRVYEICSWPGVMGVEIEPDWACADKRSVVGDSQYLPFPDATFSQVITSPCLHVEHKILRSDFRWVPAGFIREGDELIAFDEETTPKTNSHNHRRKWRIATVTNSVTEWVECVRVKLANGDSIVCTPEHPWLVERSRSSAKWVEAKDLLKYSDRPSKVLQQLKPWEQQDTYDHGWLSGMFDGEGSLAFGNHGSPKLSMCQVDGVVGDLIQERLTKCGYQWSSIPRKVQPLSHKPITNYYINGGFPEIMRALGELRPERLIRKFNNLELSSRCIQPWGVEVISVTPCGFQRVQRITTSTGTYIGEGYLHHNCYGNRMADHHAAMDDSKRHTYRHYLGHELKPQNAGGMTFGKRATSPYKVLHRNVWVECYRVMTEDSQLILNISNHMKTERGVNKKTGEKWKKTYEVEVAQWHRDCLREIGFKLEQVIEVPTKRNRHGRNGDVRCDVEYVSVFRKGNIK